MVLETLLLYACLTQPPATACQPALRAYQQQYPSVQEIAKQTEEKVKRLLPGVFVQYALPLALFGSGARADIKLYSKFYATCKYRENTIIYYKSEF